MEDENCGMQSESDYVQTEEVHFHPHLLSYALKCGNERMSERFGSNERRKIIKRGEINWDCGIIKIPLHLSVQVSYYVSFIIFVKWYYDFLGFISGNYPFGEFEMLVLMY